MKPTSYINKFHLFDYVYYLKTIIYSYFFWVLNLRFFLLEYIFCNYIASYVNNGTLTVQLPNGRGNRIFGKRSELYDDVKITILDYRFFTLVFSDGSNGFSEAYIENYFETDDLTKLLTFFSYNAIDRESIVFRILSFFGEKKDTIRHWLKTNNKENSKKNIHFHYDLSNEMFEQFLDKSMTYSSGIFYNLEEDPKNLYKAQMNKYNRIINELDIKKDEKILEIGCGWGWFSITVALERDCKVTGISLSKNQLEFAEKIIEKKKLENKIELRYQDYRDVKEKYDKIVSIEMIEAVGHEHMDSYFKSISDRLEYGGSALIQAISVPDNRYESYRRSCDFIQKYIFPGGLCPSLGVINNFAAKYDLIIDDVNNFALDYAKTLRCWLKNFKQNWEEIEKLGFDSKFYRLWEYYLCYCETGFDLGLIKLYQIKLVKTRN